MVHIGNSWDELLKNEWSQPYYTELRAFLASEYRARDIFPPMNDIFNAFRFCPYEKVKVVILGQDPLSDSFHNGEVTISRTGRSSYNKDVKRGGRLF